MNLASKSLGQWLAWVVGLILVLLPFSTFLTTWLGANFGHLQAWRLWPDFVIVALVPATIVLVVRSDPMKNWLRVSWVVRLYAIYILLHLATGIWALGSHYVNSSALIDGLITNLSFVGFFLVTLFITSTNDWLRRNWAKLVILPAAVVVGFGWLERFILPLNWLGHFGYGPKTTLAYQTVDAHSGLPRLQSTLRGPNPLGAYLAMILPALFGVFWRRWVLLLGTTIATMVVLFYSYSRSAIVAGLLAAGLLVWWVANPQTKKWLISLCIVVAIVGGAGLYIERNSLWIQENLFHTSSNSSSPKTSNEQRRSALRAGIKDIIHQPLGRGPGTAGPGSVHNNHPSRIAENYYVQIGQEVGVAGVAIFIAINLLVARNLWQLRQQILSKILLVSLLGISLINLVSHAWADSTLALIWWGLAGIALAPILKVKQNEATRKPA